MEEIRNAIITEDKAVICPYCYKKNGQLTGIETIINFKMRCRASNAKLQHYFLLNYSEVEEKIND